MRQRLVYILALVTIVLSSCVNQNLSGDDTIDFGIQKFFDPYYGIKQESRPKWLESVVSTIYTPDTPVYSKTIELTFNEESVRSHSGARLYMVDSLGRSLKNVTVKIGKSDGVQNGHFVMATLDTMAIPVTVQVNPVLGDTTLKCYIAIESKDIDEANEVSIASESVQPVQACVLRQEVGPAWWIWLLLAIIALCVIFVLGYLLYEIIRRIIVLIGLIAISVDTVGSMPPPIPHLSGKSTNKRKDKAKEEKKKEEKKKCPCCRDMNMCSRVFSNPNSSIAERCKTLLKITDEWETWSEDKKIETYEKMCPKMRALLDSFWDGIYKPTPTNNNGRWVGRKGNGVFYFNDDYVPPEKNNRDGMTWKELVQAYKRDFNLHVDGGIHYKNNRIDLRSYAVATVKIKYEDSNLEKLKARGGSEDTVQVIGAKLFEKILRKEISKGRYVNFWNFKDGMRYDDFVRNTPLVIHEDYDGETLMLVPKYLHDNLSHYGGIALVSAVVLNKEMFCGATV